MAIAQRRSHATPALAMAAVILATLGPAVPAWAQAKPPTHETQAATHDDAKNLGRAWANSQAASVRNGAAEASTVRQIVPGYTDQPPEAQAYRQTNPGVLAAQRRAHCAANPADPECAAAAVGTAARPNLGITPAHPALVGQAAASNPTQVLGSVASAYNACSVGGTMVSAATWSEESCTLTSDPWGREVCHKHLTASPAHTATCAVGAVIASANLSRGGADTMDVQAICTAQGLGHKPGHVRFRANARGGRGACSGPLEVSVDLTRPIPEPGGMPQVLGHLQPHWGGGCRQLAVVWEGPGCQNGHCTGNIHFVMGEGVYQPRVCTGNGEVLGSLIEFRDPGYSTSDANCYKAFEGPEAPGAFGRPGGWGVVNWGDAYWYARTSASVEHGWAWTSHERWTAALSFVEPRFKPAAGDRWSNGCAHLEAITPDLTPDGVAPLEPGIMLTRAPAGTRQCVRSESVCTDGPSTRLIDGVAVTRECWAYRNVFDCSRVAVGSGCTDASLDRCTPAGTKCTVQDAMGRCVSSINTLSCPSTAAQFTTALNCGGAHFCSDGSCWDMADPPNDGFALAVSQMQAHMEAAKDFDTETVQIFKGTDRRCTRDTFGLDNCCKADSAIFQKCSAEAQETVRQRDQGRCVSLGDYCSARTVLGVCRERTQTYCCHSSLLARLVQQQGRAQIGRGWGTAENPNCVGFSPDEIAMLNWAAFDLSEFYAQIKVTPPPSATDLSTGAQNAQPRCYFGQGRC